MRAYCCAEMKPNRMWQDWRSCSTAATKNDVMWSRNNYGCTCCVRTVSTFRKPEICKYVTHFHSIEFTASCSLSVLINSHNAFLFVSGNIECSLPCVSVITLQYALSYS